MTTPNMNLTLPVVSQTLGPQWASEINADLSLIDSHNHTSGNGALVPVAGLNMNADLSLATNALTNVKRLGLLDQVSLSLSNSVYAKGGDLWWYNSSGDDVQITNGNAVNVGPTGNIGGIVPSAAVNYDSPTLSFVFDDENSNPAGLTVGTVDCSSVVIDGITVNRSSGSGAYTLSLPSAAPGSNSFLTCTTGGAIGYITQTNGIQRSMLVAVGQIVPAYQYDGPISAPGNLLLPVNITTTGRPLFVGVTTITTAPNSAGIRLNNAAGANYCSASLAVNITSASPPVGFTAGNYLNIAFAGEVSASGALIIPASSLNGIVALPAGTYTLQCVLTSISGGGTPNLAMNGSLFAYEL
jgi:hypothetical protein